MSLRLVVFASNVVTLRQLITTVMIQSHCFYFNKQPYALELLHEKEKAIIIR